MGTTEKDGKGRVETTSYINIAKDVETEPINDRTLHFEDIMEYNADLRLAICCHGFYHFDQLWTGTYLRQLPIPEWGRFF